METIETGAWMLGLGVLAWILSDKFHIRLVGKAWGLYLFPVIGVIVILYGLLTL